MTEPDQLFDISATKPKMAPAKFIEGPLAGQHHDVPEHGPAWVRYFEGEQIHWYVWKKGTKRTYLYSGATLWPTVQHD